VGKKSKAVITIETSKLTVIRRIRRADESHSSPDRSGRKHGSLNLQVELSPTDENDMQNTPPRLKSHGEHK